MINTKTTPKKLPPIERFGGPNQSYPALGIYNSRVVLFTAQDTGVCVDAGGSACYVGEVRDNWSTDCYTAFDGSVTISNS